MGVYYLLYSILIIQGVSCVQFLIQGDGIACIVGFITGDGIPSKISDKSCILIGDDYIWPFDYHFTQRSMYYVNYETGQLTSIRLPLSFYSEKNSSNIVNFTGRRVHKLVVDWIHDTFYVISGDLLMGNLSHNPQGITLQNVITKQDLITLCNQTTMNITDVHVDPYTKSLFILASGDVYGNDTYIISSDLNGNSLKIVLKKPYFIQNTNFNIDVNEKILYLSHEQRLYEIDYDGTRENIFNLQLPSGEFTVLGNHFYYLLEYEGNILYEVFLNHTENKLQDFEFYDPELPVGEKTFKVLDIHIQRQKRNGSYICDRDDCPYLCEVRSSGDTCVCRKTDAKDRNGVTCYTCGQSNLTSTSTQPTIVNGKISYPSNFPWHAVLYSTKNWGAFCGGSLITSSVVLTAAHCVTSSCETCKPTTISNTDLMVALGKTYRSWNHFEAATVKANVTKIIVNEHYMGKSFNYAQDIALLFLDVTVKSNNYIMPACLDYNLNQLPAETSFTGYIAGFGYTEECKSTCSSQSNTLLYTTAPVMSFNDCYKTSNEISKTNYHSLTSDKICIGNGSVSAVQPGDSGGGLTLAYHGLHYVVGIVSHKLMKPKGQKYEYSFGAFTNVSEYINWIKQNIPEGP